MSFPRYPAYKDSGVEWLGEVPEHWRLLKVKKIASFSGGGTPSRENLSYWNGDIPWVSPKDMKGERIVDTEESITEEGLQGSASYLLPPGRVLMVVRSGILKHTIPVAINEVAVALNQDMKAFDFKSDACLGRFFLRWTQGLNDRLLLAWAKQGATVESIEHAYLADTVIPTPPIAEQNHIAAFLDKETAKVDALVAEQRRLIELLKEKRQAVISHAVTKGLIPHAPMKPSGIEWLGDVPAHWKVGKCGFYVSILSGFAFPSASFTDDETDTRLLRGINVGVLRIRWDQTVYWRRSSNDGLDHFELCAGDIVIGMDRPLISEGIRVAKIRESDLPCLLLQRVASLKCQSQINADYPLGLIASEMFVAHFFPETTGVSVPHISPEQIQNFVIPIPPVAEQLEIAAFFAAKTDEIDTLATEAQRAIDLLQERRIALISAAVTGQIDVRGLVDVEAA